jgi:hypothetical protein
MFYFLKEKKIVNEKVDTEISDDCRKNYRGGRVKILEWVP